MLSPPNGVGAVAMTVSEPPSAMLRAAAERAPREVRRDVLERVDHDDGVAAAGRDAAALLDRLLDGLRLRVGRAGERDGRDRRGLGPVAGLLGPHAGEHDEQLQPLAARERLDDAARQLALAGARAAADQHARALAERRQPLDGLERHVVGAERQALGRPGGRQVLELRALGDLVGRAAVDRVDADERREALGAARRAHRAGDPVAGHELAALDLRGGDVDVVVGGLALLPEADEGGAVAEQLDDALDDAVLALAVAASRSPRGPVAVAAAAVAVAAAVVAVLAPAAAAAAAAPAARAGGRVLVGGAVLLGLGLDAASASASASVSTSESATGAALARERRRGLGASSSSHLGGRRLGAGLARDDRVDQVGLAQAAEAVDAELVGDQVEVGERALLERVAVQDGRHVVLLGSVMVGWRSGRVVRSGRQPMHPQSLAVGVAIRREALRGRQHALAAQHAAHGEEVGRGAHVVHAHDVRAGVRRPADRGQRRGTALARGRGR